MSSRRKSHPWYIPATVIAFALTVKFSGAELPSGGIRMNYNIIAVENLPPGEPVSMKGLANLPLVLGNHARESTIVSVTILKPVTLRPGYEAIPDTDWVRMATNRVEIPGSKGAELDVVIHFPGETNLFSRKFQADLVAETIPQTPSGSLHLRYRLTGSLLLSTAPTSSRMTARNGDAQFSLNPPRLDLKEGTARIPVASQLINESRASQTYTLRAVDPMQTQVIPDRGSRIGNPADVTVIPEQITLDAGAATNLNIGIRATPETGTDLKRIFYLIAVHNGMDQAVTKYLKIYVKAEKPY